MHHSTPLQVPYPFPISPPGSTISTVSIKLDPVQHLPPELCLHILSFIHDPKTLTACCAVNRAWKELLQDEEIWRTVVRRFGYAPSDRGSNTSRPPGEEDENILLSRGVKEILKREFSIGELTFPVRSSHGRASGECSHISRLKDARRRRLLCVCAGWRSFDPKAGAFDPPAHSSSSF